MLASWKGEHNDVYNSIYIYKTVVCDRVCVHSHFIGRMRISAPHSEISWHAAIPRQVPEIWVRWLSIVYGLESPNVESANSHLSPFHIRHNPCHSCNIFPDWKFSGHKVSRSLKATRQLQRTGVRCWYDAAGLRGARSIKLESRSFPLLLFVSKSRTSHVVRFRQIRFLFRATSPEPPGTDKGWEGGVDKTGGRNQLLNRLPQVLIKHYEKKPAYGDSPLCNRVFREIRNQGAWLHERRVKYLEMNYFETANSQVFPPATDQSWNWDMDDTDVLFVVGTHGS